VHIRSLRTAGILSATVLVFLGPIITAAATITLPSHAAALSGNDFQSGRIVDDGVYFNNGGFTVQDIQTFLNSKVPSCDTNGTQPYNGTTRAQYGASKGFPAPYTCLKDFHQTTTNKPAEAGLCTGYGQVNQSSAEIIFGVAQSCGINPRVLIVLLQKEQALVTDDWPWSRQYDAATGYGCPDTAACDTQYSGFFNQVYSAARQFKYYAKNANSFNFLANRNNSIQYNPSAGCGSSNVTIQNQSTADMYNYTPYQPNQAALNNLDGSGDGCSAYGNRNFWVYYSRWFGSTFGTKFPLKFERLEGNGSPISNIPDTLAGFNKTLTANGVLHNFYYDVSRGALRHAWSDSSGWHFESLDGPGAPTGRGQTAENVGGYITAYYDDTAQTIRLFYYDYTTRSLRHAWTDATGWHFETLDGRGALSGRGQTTNDVGRGVTAVSFQNTIQLFYYDADYGNLRHAWHDGTNWNFENLDGDRGAISGRDANVGFMPASITYAGSLQLFYYDGSSGNLRHAWFSGGWRFENMDGDRGSVGGSDDDTGHSPSLAVYNGSLQLFYYDASGGILRHAWLNPNWKFENLDGRNSVFGRPHQIGQFSTTKQFGNDLYVYYYDIDWQTWRMAWSDQYGWHVVDLDGTNTSITGNSAPVAGQISFDEANGVLQLFYQDSARALKHAWSVP
jgi:hypothetical protein